MYGHVTAKCRLISLPKSYPSTKVKPYGSGASCIRVTIELCRAVAGHIRNVINTSKGEKQNQLYFRGERQRYGCETLKDYEGEEISQSCLVKCNRGQDLGSIF